MGRMDAYVYMTKSLCGPPEAVTTLLIGYTPIFKKKFKGKKLLLL